MPSIADRATLTAHEIMQLQDQAQTQEELDAISAIGEEVLQQKLKAAVDRFRENSDKFVAVTEAITGHIARIKKAHPDKPTPSLDSLLTRFGGVLGELHDRDAIRKTDEAAPAVSRDEDDIKPAPKAAPLAAGPRPEPPLASPKPLNAKGFEQLADEYSSFFLRSQIRPERADKVRSLADKVFASKARYQSVGAALDIPWWWIGGAHLLESTLNFTRHLHNGDPLTARTTHVPAGRPAGGTPPFTWEASARDALEQDKLAGLADWSLPRALWRWERFNGFGYRRRGVPTPYLWSFSTIYEKGKFVADGKFDANAVSEQCGAAVLLKALHQGGKVPELGLDVVAEDESAQPDANADIQPVVAGNLPNIDNNVPAGGGFQAFFAQRLPDIKHFQWHEFLVKGASNGANHLNTDPPEELWPNVVPLVRVLEAFREKVGQSVVLTSVYRSPAYNASIGGASRSQHMAFIAADFKVNGGNPGQWADRLKELRSQGLFEGGIGIYGTFVHVDVRGSRADWDLR